MALAMVVGKGLLEYLWLLYMLALAANPLATTAAYVSALRTLVALTKGR